jgi:hypothetical protein
MVTVYSTISENSRPAIASYREETDPRLRLTVVYTTMEATLAALRTAADLAEGLGGQIELAAIQVVHHSLPLDQPPIPLTFFDASMRALVSEAALDADSVSIEICLCRDRRACLERLLPPHSVVVLGGKGTWWSEERKLGHWLTSLGHHVIFVDVSHPRQLNVTDVFRHVS